MSGEVVASRAALGSGPSVGRADTPEPFSPSQLARIDEALTLSSRETGLTFSLYVGELADPSRVTAETLFSQLVDAHEPVLIAVSPGQRILQIVTGEGAARRLPNRSCALAALGMRASFSNGDLTGGIVNGLRMLADAAGRR
ncbi:MAG: DUF5130 family protein [Actinomycetota bacterium]